MIKNLGRAVWLGGALLLSGAALAAATGAPAWAQTASRQRVSDEEIRQQIIRQSIAAYPGSCACPYNVMRNGRRCGKNSAWSKPGGHAPKCYAEDVSATEVAAYRNARRASLR